MKFIKKLFLSLLAIGMFFSTFITVFADNTGSILINGTVNGKVYEIYKIFDLTYQEKKVSYTIDTDWKKFFEEDGKEYIVDTNTSNLNQITIGSETKYINITSDNIEEFTQKALIYASNLEGNDGSETATGESLSFSNLALGYYLVYPKGATDIIEGNGSICSITSTVPDGVVNIKATYPTIEKTVDDQNAEVGQLVQFTVTGLVPDTTGFDSYTYKITDTMTDGLKFDLEVAEFTVKFGEEKIDVTPTYQDNGFVLTFDMVSYQKYVGKEIKITYKAKVEEAAVNSSTTKNSVTLTYSNDPKTDELKTTTPIEIPVYSSLINVIKVDANNEEERLAGASFVIQNSDGEYYQALDKDGQIITDIDNTNNLTDVNWVSSFDEATLLITTETGIITFKGVENGTYYLVEVDAPLGYNKLTGPVTLKVGYSNEEETNLANVAVSHTEIVKNNSGTALPETGGIGTKLFIIIGSLLTIMPVIFFVVNKRMIKES